MQMDALMLLQGILCRKWGRLFFSWLLPPSFVLQLLQALRKMSMMLRRKQNRAPSCYPVSMPNCWNYKRLIGPLYIWASRNINSSPVAVSWTACSCYSQFSFSRVCLGVFFLKAQIYFKLNHFKQNQSKMKFVCSSFLEFSTFCQSDLFNLK